MPSLPLKKNLSPQKTLKFTVLFTAVFTLFTIIYMSVSETVSLLPETVNSVSDSQYLRRSVKSRSPITTPTREPLIYMATGYYHAKFFPNVADCPKYNNCKIDIDHKNNMTLLHQASVVIWQRSQTKRANVPNLPWKIRSNQLWILKNQEPPAYKWYRYPKWFNGIFNLSLTYRPDSDITVTYQPFKLVRREKPIPSINYKQGKTKGALAIVSHCDSLQYDRLRTIKTIGKYIDVDIFGRCGEREPCGRMNFSCEATTYKRYHFFLSFENALCKNYVTEKFWQRLMSAANFVPVAVGGINQSDYIGAPPHSFIHLYDFGSAHLLGAYLRKLINDTEEYNSYHTWKESYLVDKSVHPDAIPTCEICRLANVLPRTTPRFDLARSWNNNACSNFIDK